MAVFELLFAVLYKWRYSSYCSLPYPMIQEISFWQLALSLGHHTKCVCACVQFNHVQAQLRNLLQPSVYTYVYIVHVAVDHRGSGTLQLVLYAVPGSIWPTDSLLDKFRRLCHRNEVRYTCPTGYHGKPKSL